MYYGITPQDKTYHINDHFSESVSLICFKMLQKVTIRILEYRDKKKILKFSMINPKPRGQTIPSACYVNYAKARATCTTTPSSQRPGTQVALSFAEQAVGWFLLVVEDGLSCTYMTVQKADILYKS